MGTSPQHRVFSSSDMLDQEIGSHCRKDRHKKEGSRKSHFSVNDRYYEALDCGMHQCADGASTYDDEVLSRIAKWLKRFEVQMKLKYLMQVILLTPYTCSDSCFPPNRRAAWTQTMKEKQWGHSTSSWRIQPSKLWRQGFPYPSCHVCTVKKENLL